MVGGSLEAGGGVGRITPGHCRPQTSPGVPEIRHVTLLPPQISAVAEICILLRKSGTPDLRWGGAGGGGRKVEAPRAAWRSLRLLQALDCNDGSPGHTSPTRRSAPPFRKGGGKMLRCRRKRPGMCDHV